jgi:lactoylglutathione lyase
VTDGKIVGLAHIGLVVENLERSKKFYTDILGFEVFHECSFTKGNSVFNVAFARLNDCTLELVELAEYPGKSDGLISHVALKTENIEAVRLILIEKGIIFESEDMVHRMEVFPPFGTKWLMFRGPDNERLEINEIQKW